MNAVSCHCDAGRVRHAVALERVLEALELLPQALGRRLLAERGVARGRDLRHRLVVDRDAKLVGHGLEAVLRSRDV